MKLSKTRHSYRIKNRTNRPRIVDVPRLLYPLLSWINGIRPGRWKVVPSAGARIVEREADAHRLANNQGESFWIPAPVPKVEFKRMRRGYVAFYADRKYQNPGFVEVEDGDVVIDCGAFVGGFSIAASRKASRVYAVEPSPFNYACLARNTVGITNISLTQAGLFNEGGNLTFNIGNKPFDSSLLDPDSGGTKTRVDVRVYEINEFMDEQGIDTVDFLKVEAEGVEMEILENIDPARVRKIVVDCNPERGGESPLLDIAVLLDSKGYQLANLDYILFARRQDGQAD